VRRAGLVIVVACAHAAPHPPDDPVKTELSQAEAAERARHHDEARVHYERAVASAKDAASAGLAHREYAETLATWGELDQARSHYEAAVAATPGDAVAWHDLGIVRANAAIGDVPGALAALQRAKTLAPNALPPRRDLAVLHWKLGHRAEALAEYREMLQLDLPPRLREKVQWAIDQLSSPPRASAPAMPPSS